MAADDSRRGKLVGPDEVPLPPLIEQTGQSGRPNPQKVSPVHELTLVVAIVLVCQMPTTEFAQAAPPGEAPNILSQHGPEHTASSKFRE